MAKVEGLDNFLKDLKTAAQQAPDRASKAVKSATFRLQGKAKKSAPVDTGKLRQSINVEPFEDNGLTGKVSAGGAIAPYAPYIEFGTGGKVSVPNGWEEIARQFKGTTGRKISMKPQPYLIPNYIIESKTLIDELSKIVKELK